MVSEVKESSDYFGQFSTCFMDIIEQSQQVMHHENSAYFKDITVVQSLFSPRGEIPRYRHTQRVQEIHLGTLLVKGERNTGIHNLVVKGERSGYRQDPVIVQVAHWHNPYGKRERVRDTQIIQRAARPNRMAGKQRPSPRRAETITREGANQDIKESGHRSRRPPAYKG